MEAEVAATAVENEPGSHKEQCGAEAADQAPAGQADGWDVPDLGQKKPAVQAWHVEAEVAATAVENVPGLHKEHCGAEVADQPPA